jgi:hypothetical protein
MMPDAYHERYMGWHPLPFFVCTSAGRLAIKRCVRDLGVVKKQLRSFVQLKPVRKHELISGQSLNLSAPAVFSMTFRNIGLFKYCGT